MLTEIKKEIAELKNQINEKDRKKQRFINFLGLSGLTILLSAFLLTLLGVVNLRIVSEVKVPIYVDTFISYILHLANFCFWIFVIKAKLIYILPYSLIYFITGYFVTSNTYYIQSFILPITYMAIVYLLDKKINVITFLITLAIVSIFQVTTGLIKLGYFYFDGIEINCLIKIIYSLDLYIFYIAYVKGVFKNVFLLEHFIFSKSKRIECTENPSKETIDTSDLNARQKVIFALLAMGYQVMQLLVVLAIGFINNMFVELIAMLIMFWLGRNILQKSWHSDTLWLCSVATFTGFYILTKITPPFEISLFMVVVLTGSFIYLLHVLGVKADRLEELEKKYDSDYTKYNLSAEMAKFAYDWLTEGMHDKELMIKYEINSVNTLNSRKRRIKQAMNTK